MFNNDFIKKYYMGKISNKMRQMKAFFKQLIFMSSCKQVMV